MDFNRLNIHRLRAKMSDEEISEILGSLSEEESELLMYNWGFWARKDQMSPPGDWFGWLILCGRGWGKHLALNTRVLSANRGWVNWGDLKVGDTLFTEKGCTTKITHVHPVVTPEKCYSVNFDDGSSIVASSSHRWATLTAGDRSRFHKSISKFAKNRYPLEWIRLGHVPLQGPQLPEDKFWRVKALQSQGKTVSSVCNSEGLRKKTVEKIFNLAAPLDGLKFDTIPEGRIKTTQEMANTLVKGGKKNHCIPCCYPLRMDKKQLPIHPYLLGLWLGDGNCETGSISGYLEKVSHQIHILCELGYSITGWRKSSPASGPENRNGWYRVDGLTSLLSQSGLRNNKHVPQEYLYSCEEDRKWLLAGLLDTDGHARRDGVVEFSNTNRDVVDAVHFLVVSLGMKARIRVAGSPSNILPIWLVSITPNSEIFKYEKQNRNLRKVKKLQNVGRSSRIVVDIVEVPSVPMMCITVDNENESYLVGENLICSINTRTGSEWIIQRARDGYGPIALIGETTADVRDTMIEVGESSIMRCSHKGFMPVYEPSKRRLTWPNGVTATTFTGQEPDQLRGPQHQCFVAGTAIETRSGESPIEALKVGEEVLTRGGWCKVEAVRSYVGPTGRVRFSSGRDLVATPDHPVWSLDRNCWVWMVSLRENERVLTGEYLKAAMSMLTGLEKKSTSTGGCGSISMGKYPVDFKFTIGTTTEKIIARIIWLSSAQQNTCSNIRLGCSSLGAETVGLSTTQREMLEQVDAESVEQGFTKPVAKALGCVNIAEGAFYLAMGCSAASVVSTWEDVGEDTVYSLQVEKHHEYIANGIVVSNTVWADEPAKWDYAEECVEQFMYGLRLGKLPRFLATTTPRPIKVIKEWYKDPSVVKTIGSTFDNTDNLAPAFIKQMLKKYKGTRMGEQELYGKILWESDHALWSQTQIDEFRIEESRSPPSALSCISLDPTVGDPNKGKGHTKQQIDECGIMTGYRGIDGHGYVTGDYTLRGTPMRWAKKVEALLAIGDYDFVVAEANQGGKLVEETLVSYGIPRAKIVLVHASQGKLVRAEPISLIAEQGKIHHVGNFVQLEEELVTYEGAGKSPNRLDAYVWMFTFLLMKEKRKTVVKDINV